MEGVGFQKAPKNCRTKGGSRREGEIEGGKGKKEIEICNQKVLLKSDTEHTPLVV